MKKLKEFRIKFVSGNPNKRFVFIRDFDKKGALRQFWAMYTSANTKLFACEEVIDNN